jgi:PTS system nitrogen regulatory IIA component
VLLAREALGSTGIGGGIAIPHPRNPIVLHVDHPTIAVCFLTAPVEFRSLDGQPVHTLFTLVSPTVRTHLHLLSRLAHALKDGSFHAAIVRRDSDQEILKAARQLDATMISPTDESGRGAA